MLLKVFAVMFVIGLLVTGPAAFVANHPRALPVLSTATNLGEGPWMRVTCDADLGYS